MVKTYCLFESRPPLPGQPDPRMDCRISGSSVSCDKPGSYTCGQIDALGSVIRRATTTLNPAKRTALMTEINQNVVGYLELALINAAGNVELQTNIRAALNGIRAIPRSTFPNAGGGRRKTYRRKQKKNKTRRRR